MTYLFGSLHSSLHFPHVRGFASSACRDSSADLTHLDHTGRPAIVDVTEKRVTKRSAIASGRIFIPPIAYELITSTYPETSNDASLLHRREKVRRKGDALTVAQLAAIMACKKTPDLIPLCHPLLLTHISVTFTPELPEPARGSAEPAVGGNTLSSRSHSIVCRATVSCEDKTGVEMEALTAVSVGLLTVWDMLKAVAGKEMEIGQIKVIHKEGGRSGDFTRDERI